MFLEMLPQIEAEKTWAETVCNLLCSVLIHKLKQRMPVCNLYTSIDMYNAYLTWLLVSVSS